MELADVIDCTLERCNLLRSELLPGRGEFLARYRKAIELHPVEALRVGMQSCIALSTDSVDDIKRHRRDVSPGLQRRPRQCSAPLALRESIPIKNTHDSGQHLFNRQDQQGACAGLFQAFERFPEHVLTTHGVNCNLVRVALERNDGR